MQSLQSTPFRVAIYARVSTEEQRQGQTIDSQIAELEKFAQERGWIVASTFKDEGWSGAMIARPALDRLRDDGAQKRFDAVLINDVDRLARDVTHLGIIKRDFERHGASVIFRKLPADNTPSSNLMVNIMGSFAEYERQMIADRTRRGRRHKIEVRRQFIGCAAPYGYRYEKAVSGTGRLVIEPREADFVRMMFKWVAEEGLSIRRVADRLSALKAPTRRGSPTWATCSVHKMLRNEVYTGFWQFYRHESVEPKKPRNAAAYRRTQKTSRRKRPKSEWVRIALPKELRMVDRELWSRAQQQIDRNPKFSPRNMKYQYLLQGLLRCATCSGTCAGSSTIGTATGKRYFYYQCWRHCQGWIPRARIENAIWQKAVELLGDPERIRKYMSCARPCSLAPEPPRETPEVKLAASEYQAFRQYQEGRITAAGLADQLDVLKAASRDVDSEPKIPAKLPSNEQLQQWAKTISAKLPRFLADAPFELRREVLRRLADQILVFSDRLIIRGRIGSDDRRDHSSFFNEDQSAPEAYLSSASPHLRECRRKSETDLSVESPHLRECRRSPEHTFTVEVPFGYGEIKRNRKRKG